MGMTIGRRYGLILWVVALVFIGVSAADGQSFRGEVSSREAISSDTTVERSITSGEILLFYIEPTARRFVAGLEVTIEPSSESIAAGSFSAAVFGAVDPPDEHGIHNLAGQRLETLPLTDPQRHRLFIPFDSDHSNNLDTATRPADPTIGDIALQLVPIMKGMDSTALSAAYSVRVSPRIRPIGAVRVTLTGEADLVERTEDLLQLSLNGEEIALDTVVERAPGIYRLEARAGDFLDTASNVGVEQGNLREIVLEPQEPRARIRVSVPTVAEVYWNGTRLVDQNSFTAPPGEHAIMIRLGDYTVSRRIQLEADEDYELAVDLDILLKRN
ncbi:MAG: hypothetical protein ACOCYB_04870 [Alkalispirochaeta sp.]